jgi:Flp pilus assembly protein TadD
MKEGDYGGAVKEYETAIKLAPTVDHYYAHLALALRALGRDREEEECLEKAVHADPAYAPSHYELAELLASKGQVEEAVAELTKAIQCDPQFVSSYYLLATTYRRMGKQDQAEAALRQARKVQYELAELLVSKGQFEQAVAKLRKAIQRDPLFANFYYLLATAYRRMGKQQLAEATLGELGKVQPEGSRDTRDLAPTD